MPTLPITIGRIIWARVPDSRSGGEFKRRPLVVVRAPSSDDATFDWVGGSTVPPKENDAAYCVELPHAGPPRGHRYTRLQEPTFVYCYWTGRMRIDEIENPERDIFGMVHEVQLERILTIVNELTAEAAATKPSAS